MMMANGKRTHRTVPLAHVEPRRGRGGAVRADRADDAERGSVTAEFAVILPSVVALVAVLVSVGVYGARAVAAQEAARTTARSVARGDPWETARANGQGIIGGEAKISIEKTGGGAEITVVSQAPGVLGDWGGLEIHARAYTDLAEEAVP